MGGDLLFGHIGSMPPEIDVTKSTEKRVEESMEVLQIRSSMPDIIIKDDLKYSGVVDPSFEHSVDPIDSLRKKLLQQLKGGSNGP